LASDRRRWLSVVPKTASLVGVRCSYLVILFRCYSDPLFGDWRLVIYGALFWLACHVFVVYEEPTLQRTFGAEYESFCANVPRWIPRLTPWRAPQRVAGTFDQKADELFGPW